MSVPSARASRPMKSPTLILTESYFSCDCERGHGVERRWWTRARGVHEGMREGMRECTCGAEAEAKHGHAGHVQQSDGVQVRRCGGATVWRCDGVEVRLCGGATVTSMTFLSSFDLLEVRAMPCSKTEDRLRVVRPSSTTRTSPALRRKRA